MNGHIKICIICYDNGTYLTSLIIYFATRIMLHVTSTTVDNFVYNISDHTTFTFEFVFPDNPIKSCLSDFSKIDLISINNMPYSYNLSNLHR